jgi:hypothetical protein|uniref:Glycosyltransferase n=1 Tax=viral metagenome TaxID=1070528 RepID=A0A6C0B2Q5_9ZZZZ
MDKIAIVNFANAGNSRYELGQENLRKSFETFDPDIPFFALKNYEEFNSQTHAECPYGFKVAAVEHVRKLGYDVIIWIDSSLRLIKSIRPLIRDIASKGIYLQGDCWKCGEWANDRSLEYFNISRDDAMQIQNIHAIMIGFDFRHPATMPFFERWKKCAADGIFRGSRTNDNNTESKDPRCKGHRGDQTCLELVGNELKINYSPKVWSYNVNDPTRYFSGW